VAGYELECVAKGRAIKSIVDQMYHMLVVAVEAGEGDGSGWGGL